MDIRWDGTVLFCKLGPILEELAQDRIWVFWSDPRNKSWKYSKSTYEKNLSDRIRTQAIYARIRNSNNEQFP